MTTTRRKKRGLSPVYVVSIGLHLAIGAVLALVPQQKLREVVAIALNEAPEKKPEPPKPKPHPTEAPKVTHAPRAARAPSAAQASAQAAPSAAPVFTDLGLMLDATASGGLAVNVAPQPSHVKAVSGPALEVVKPKIIPLHKPEPECVQLPVKARPLDLARPSYTDDARRAGVQGRIRIELAINEQGEVTNARIIEGLGHGLDEEALAAARRVRFSPAQRCGKPVSTPFVIAMRFVLGS